MLSFRSTAVAPVFIGLLIFGVAPLHAQSDCNDNGVDDADDIAACAGSPSCDDCNLNGVPDECDIAGGFSLDEAPADGVPDECMDFAQSPPGTCTGLIHNSWSCPENWGLPDPFYPLNGLPAGSVYSPTLDALPGPQEVDHVFLDVDTTINGLRIIDGAVFHVIQLGGVGDLNFDPPGEILLEGHMMVGDDRLIGLGGTVRPRVTIGRCGMYQKDPIFSDVEAQLHAREIVVLAGGELELVDEMSVTVTGDFIADGTQALLATSCDPPSAVGVVVPTRIRLWAALLNLNIAGNMILTGHVEIDNTSSDGVLLGGDFHNQSIAPSLYDWTQGKLTMTGQYGPQLLEVAGLDLGLSLSGYQTDADTLHDTDLHTNFTIQTLQIGTTETPADVTFINNHPSTRGTADCDEALYVHTLILKTGSVVRTRNCNVYYAVLVNEGGDLVPAGECGNFRSLNLPPMPGPDPSALRKNRSLSIDVPATATSGPGPAMSALRVRMIDLQNPQPPNAPCCPPPDFSGYESASTCADPGGCVRWVGPAATFLESQDSPSQGSFVAARLQCTPFYHTFGAQGPFHIFGGEIAPSSQYDVENVDGVCMRTETNCLAVSPPLRLSTARFADVAGPYNPPSPSSQPDGLDVNALVHKFKNLSGALSKSIALLQPNSPELNQDVSALDIVACVDAFKGFAYPFTGPCPCPSTVTCEATPCANPTPCGGGTCTRTCNGGIYAGLPCINNTHCPGGGVCSLGFCRDRCGRCTPP